MPPVRRAPWLILLALLALLLPSAEVRADEPAPERPAPRRRWPGRRVPEGVTAHRDLVYAQLGDRALRLDLYVSEERETPPPLVVWIHGGGWRAGNKANCPLLWLTEKGFAVASVEYRLSGEATFPAQIHDCKGALRWLRANAKAHGFDAGRVGVAGSSAGGHLSALLGTSGGVEALEGDVGGNRDRSSRVHAVYDLYGPANLVVPIGEGRRARASPVALLLGGAGEEVAAKARAASPVTHVTADDPPFLIAHGTNDRVVSVAQSRLLHARLEAAGVSSTLHVLEGAGHGGRAFQAEDLRADVLAFFTRHLKGRDSPTTPPSAPTESVADISAHARPGPHEVGRVDTLVLRDEARAKDLQVRVTYPADRGLHPVLVFSHGAFGTKDAYGPLVEHWASHGYVVLQANHEDSRALGTRPSRDFLGRFYASRPKDVSFLLDALERIRRELPGYEGRFDLASIGVGGHSFGAHTAQLLAGATTRAPGSDEPASHADVRPRAFLLISPQGRGGELGPASWDGLARPFLVVTGTNDTGRGGQPFTWRLDPFVFAPASRKHLVLLLGAYHGFGGIAGQGRYPTSGPANAGQVDLVKAVSLLFWNAYLRASGAAAARLQSADLGTATGGYARTLHK